MVRLFHFSEEPTITEFVPRPVRIPPVRPAGKEWLNGPLVWAIAETHQNMYLFPRDCPRILLWATDKTTADDCQHWLNGNRENAIAYIERSWFDLFQQVCIFRYEFVNRDFIDIDDAGMWVSHKTVTPIKKVTLSDLPSKLKACNTELKVVDSLLPLGKAWQASVHVSGIRLRNAQGWNKGV